jgi:hypothetical protein
MIAAVIGAGSTSSIWFGAMMYGPDFGKFFFPSTENLVRTLHNKNAKTPITHLISLFLG